MNSHIEIKINQRSFIKNGTLGSALGKFLNMKEKADLITLFKMQLPTHVKVNCLPLLVERMQNTLVFAQQNDISSVKFMSGFHKDKEQSYAKLYNDNQYIKPLTYYDDGIEKNMLIFEESTFYIHYEKTRGHFKILFNYYIENDYLSFESEGFSLGELN